MAPEIITRNQMKLACDVFNFAICMPEVWVGKDSTTWTRSPTESVMKFVRSWLLLEIPECECWGTSPKIASPLPDNSSVSRSPSLFFVPHVSSLTQQRHKPFQNAHTAKAQFSLLEPLNLTTTFLPESELCLSYMSLVNFSRSNVFFREKSNACHCIAHHWPFCLWTVLVLCLSLFEVQHRLRVHSWNGQTLFTCCPVISTTVEMQYQDRHIDDLDCLFDNFGFRANVLCNVEHLLPSIKSLKRRFSRTVFTIIIMNNSLFWDQPPNSFLVF